MKKTTKMTHKKKIQKARKMQSPLERKLHQPIFDSAEWLKRKEALQTKEVSKYMSMLGKKSGALKSPEHFEKMRLKSLEVRRANKLAKENANK